MKKDLQTSKGIIYIRKFDGENPGRDDIRAEIEKLLAVKLEMTDAKIENDASGKPSVYGREVEISISHTMDTFAVYVSQNDPVGVDIETDNPLIQKARSYFMNSDELVSFPAPSLHELHLIWGAKEAVYKKFGGTFRVLENDVTVQTIDLQLSRITTDSIHGKTVCCFEKIDDLYVVWC